MDWIQDHLQIIIAVAGAIAYWLTQRKKEQAGETTDYDGDGRPDHLPKEEQFEDPELAERTRRIREEIQKKIEERRRGGAGYDRPAPAATPAEPPPMGEPAPEPAPMELPPPLVREVVVKTTPAQAEPWGELASRRQAELLEQQAALEAQLQQAQEMKAAAMRRLQFETKISAENTAATGRQNALIEELRRPDSLRRAMVLREILGPPVALR